MTNQRTVDLVVCFMGIMGIGSIIAAVYLVSVNQPIPDPLWGISGGVIVGLPSLLASLRTSASPPTPVVVQNEAGDPVLTEDVDKK